MEHVHKNWRAWYFWHSVQFMTDLQFGNLLHSPFFYCFVFSSSLSSGTVLLYYPGIIDSEIDGDDENG